MPPSRWFELRVRVPAAHARASVTDVLLALGGSAVEERGDALITHVAPPPDPERFLRAAESRLRAAAPDDVAALEWRWRKAEDWSRKWRETLRPRRVGRRLVVAPPGGFPGSARVDDIVLAIDPGMAFGTGEHATTRGMLRLLERALRPGDRVLDVGTGSAILGIAAARLGAAHVLAVDCDPDALTNARENVARNGVPDRVDLRRADVDPAWLEALGPGTVDLILANVLRGVIVPLLPGFGRAVGPGGRVLVGGILAADAERVVGAGRRAGLRPVAQDREEEWWTGGFEAARD